MRNREREREIPEQVPPTADVDFYVFLSVLWGFLTSDLRPLRQTLNNKPTPESFPPFNAGLSNSKSNLIFIEKLRIM